MAAYARRIGPNRRNTLGIIDSQKDILLAAMLEAPMLALKKLNAVERRDKWQILAARLNRLGPMKTVEQWETCWSNFMSRARANPENPTYEPIMRVIKQCEAILNNHDAETVRLDSDICSCAATNQSSRNDRRQSTAANDETIMEILNKLVESDRNRLDLEQQMVELHRDVVQVVMKQLTEIVSKVQSGRRVSVHNDA